MEKHPQWEQVKEIVSDALDYSAGEQQAFLGCGA